MTTLIIYPELVRVFQDAERAIVLSYLISDVVARPYNPQVEVWAEVTGPDISRGTGLDIQCCKRHLISLSLSHHIYIVPGSLRPGKDSFRADVWINWSTGPLMYRHRAPHLQGG